MENKKSVQHLSIGQSIRSNSAFVFLNNEMIKYNSLIKNIDSILIKCLKLNVKEYENYINCCVTETRERLSMIKKLLEALLDDINVVLDRDDLL